MDASGAANGEKGIGHSSAVRVSETFEKIGATKRLYDVMAAKEETCQNVNISWASNWVADMLLVASRIKQGLSQAKRFLLSGEHRYDHFFQF